MGPLVHVLGVLPLSEVPEGPAVDDDTFLARLDRLVARIGLASIGPTSGPGL